MRKTIKKTALMAASGVLMLATVVGLVRPVAAEDCVQAEPTVVFLSDTTQTGYPNGARFYPMDVTNNDSAACGSSTFTTTVDNSAYNYDVWGQVSPYAPVVVAPQDTKRFSTMLTAEADAPLGSYPFTVKTVQDRGDPSPDSVLNNTITLIVAPFPPPPPGDTTKPSVSITSPTNGAVLLRNKPVTIRALASDNVAVTQMVYRTNNGATTLCSGDGSLTACNWTPTKKSSYTLTVTASDAAGNSRTASVLVNVR